ncbi:MAG: alanine racemase [Clostridia bacterium]|nr:alanine racemase [Clostridia bacterium]
MDDNWDSKLLRDTYLEIDLDRLAMNVDVIRRHVGEHVDLCAVIKANGYGMGAVDIAPTLIQNGATYLAVANLPEAMELRKRNSSWPIWVMGHTPDRYLKVAIENDITLTVFTLSQAETIQEIARLTGKIQPIQIKVDTGFNRLGFKITEMDIKSISSIFELANIEVVGVFSHLALASYDEDTKQLELLLGLKAKLELDGAKETVKYHVCDSISAISYPDFRLNMVRVGAALFGAKSYRYPDFPIETIAKFKTRISHLKNIEPGEGVSYDYKWRASRNSVVATLPFGYADGYPRNMTGQGEVVIEGRRFPIIGVICMDQCMVDVTELKGAHVGQEVTIFGSDAISIDELSQKAGTNKNEILSRLMQRVPRVYMKGGSIDHIRNDLL